jgi:hypothetical protein
MRYLVCVHAGPEIGKRATLEAACALAAAEAQKRGKTCNVYPIEADGSLGFRVAQAEG